jgi:hypothetical protein
VALVIFRQYTATFLMSTAIIFNRHPSWISIFSILLVCGLLIFQGKILPAGAWNTYHGSVWFFIALQAGNLFFAALFMSGLNHIYQSWRLYPEHADIENFVILLFTMGFVAAISLVLSLWMLDKNWLLRIINYSILFMAPFAAIGFSKIRHKKIKWGSLIIASIVSLLSVVRPLSLFSC